MQYKPDISTNSKSVNKYERYVAQPHSARRHDKLGLSPYTALVASEKKAAPPDNRKQKASYRAMDAVRPVPRRRPPVSHVQIMHSLAQEKAHNVHSQSPQDEENSRSVQHKKRSKRSLVKLRLLYGVGALCFIISVTFAGAAVYFYAQTKEQLTVLSATSETDEQGIAQGTGDEPAEERPSSQIVREYRTDSNKPRYVRIPSLSIDARIKSLGLTTAGSIDAPWNIHDVGWYDGTIVPGSKSGVSLLMGHVSGRSAPGVFSRIKNLSVGEEVQVELGNGTLVTYAVTKVEEYEVDSINLSEILYDVPSGKQSLRLMTCSGVYDKQASEFKSRTVVYASPI